MMSASTEFEFAIIYRFSKTSKSSDKPRRSDYNTQRVNKSQ